MSEQLQSFIPKRPNQMANRQKLAVAIVVGLAVLVTVPALLIVGAKALLNETTNQFHKVRLRTQEREGAKQAGSLIPASNAASPRSP